jgi:hypothetical protein
MMHKSGRNDTKTPGASVKTLKDYLVLKAESDKFFEQPKQTPPEKKKLTFEQWMKIEYPYLPDRCDVYLEIWKAAQENM